MSDLPQAIQVYLAQHLSTHHQTAYLLTDAEGRLTAWGGVIDAYPLSTLAVGEPVDTYLFALTGLFPFSGEALEFPTVELDAGCIADLHVFAVSDTETCILLLNTTVEANTQQALQQKANDLSLLRAAQAKADTTAGALLQLDQPHTLSRAAVLSFDLRAPYTPDNPVETFNLYMRALAHLVQDEAGLVVQVAYPTMTALFGLTPSGIAPLSQAIRAATRLIHHLDALHARAESQGQAPLELGLGLAAGNVILGPTEASVYRGITVWGSPAFQAQKLARAAVPGELLIHPEGMEDLSNLSKTLPFRMQVLPGDSTPSPVYAQTGSSLLGAVFASMDILVLEQKPDGTFTHLGDFPNWYQALDVDPNTPDFIAQFEFLKNFLVDAEAFWANQQAGLLKSGPWQEVGLPENHYLEATALYLNGRHVLLVDHAKISLTEKKQLIQTGREQRLAHHQLLRDIEKKEILLHCIVHDLSGPLGGIQASLSLLNSEKLSDEGRSFLDLCLKQSNKLAMFIREILDAFSAEVQPFDPATMNPAEAPDVYQTASYVIKSLTPLAILHGVHLQFAPDVAPDAHWRAVGIRSKLERIFFNLLENAIWHSPSNGRITVDLRRENGTVYIGIRDEGAGVPAQHVPTLFQKFAKGNHETGKVGLGLYFCRITVEQWGGQIGYYPHEAGGSVFWFELPTISKS